MAALLQKASHEKPTNVHVDYSRCTRKFHLMVHSSFHQEESEYQVPVV